MKTIIKSIVVLHVASVVFKPCKKETAQPVARNTEFDLNITLNTTYTFYNDIYDPWGYNFYSINYDLSSWNYDLTQISGKANLPPLGELDILVEEYADTATLSDKIYLDYVQISLGHVEYISGDHSINFKKLIREGGGPFNGTLKIAYGSGKRDSNTFSSLPPLTVTGTLDVNTHIVNLRIKGKTYF